MENNNNTTNHDDDAKRSSNSTRSEVVVVMNKATYIPLLVTNFVFLFVGSLSSSLLSKYYFIHNGKSIWVSTWVQCAGFPLLLIPIFLPYYLFNTTTRKPFTRFTPNLLFLSLLIGLLLGLNNLLFSYGNSFLPVSTSALLLSSQLAFTLVLSVLIVKQKITFSNLNCVVLLVTSSVLLALSSSHDKPESTTRSQYFAGFFCTVGAGLLFALYLPVMERVYRKVYCYAMVMEMQLVMELAATALATAGMAGKGGFEDMVTESRGGPVEGFDKGTTAYWLTVGFNVVTWQLCFMGTAGMVFLTSSLTGGICMTALMTMNVIGGVVVYGDEFGGSKAVSAVLSVWGFCSYVYGMYVKMKQQQQQTLISSNHNYNQESQQNENQSMEMVARLNVDQSV
ncbi:hypothetical protein CsatB_002210 [Cannabis sativa]|uniref:probable purine permease 4 n=1 Tax=Cannabis sativa TaxID=3483 RepID=UPI0029CA3FFB|nr:probable purine permease 4 [Cannabis sativa]